MPGAWADEVRRWARDNAQRFPETAPLVDEATEYLLYQTLVGAWPIDAERAVAYMLKAVREAKVNTAWRQQNEHYEGNLDVFTRAALADADFTRDVGRFVDRLLVPGRVNGITQALLRLSCPGVPDTYQGCELWELSLVDPDNRRPVDFGLRRRLLERARRSEPRDIWATLADADDPGLAKLFTVASALRARRVAPGAFGVGSGYEPLAVVGERSGNVVAFARNDRGAGPRVCVVVQRAVSALGAWGEGAERWGDTAVRLPAAASGGGWVNALADRSEVFHAGAARAAALFGVAPAALLIEQEASAEG
jgi:(1->4)-alpha-D-glucan 1-alpha-D-glucosylmutase